MKDNLEESIQFALPEWTAKACPQIPGSWFC